MFAYCGNNPVSRTDAGGELWNFVIGGVVGGIIGGLTAAATGGDLADVLLGAATGALGGVIGASGLCAIGQVAASAALSAIGNIGSAVIHERPIDPLDVLIDAGIGAAGSLVGSLMTQKAANSAKGIIKKGINRIVSGKARYDAGSRYWKGAIKRGLSMLSEGVFKLNVAQGTASVIGSATTGGVMVVKYHVKQLVMEE